MEDALLPAERIDAAWAAEARRIRRIRTVARGPRA
jgi:hypothetical protein